MDRHAPPPVPDEELRFQYVRSAGPGGQNVNKVATKAVLHWNVHETRALAEDVRQRFLARYRRRINQRGELVLSSQRYRDQSKNTADCLEKLRQMIEVVWEPPKPRKKTRPTAASRRRRLEAKQRRAKTIAQRRPPAE